MELFQEGGDVESVDEESLSSCASCVGEKVEELKTTWVGLRIRIFRLELWNNGREVDRKRRTKYVLSVCAPRARVV